MRQEGALRLEDGGIDRRDEAGNAWIADAEGLSVPILRRMAPHIALESPRNRM